jgi:hypothetical protein
MASTSPEGGRTSVTTEFALTDVASREPGALSAEIDDEVVALDVAKGVCYALGGAGARIWALLERPLPISRLCAQLVTEFDIEPLACREEVLGFLTALAAEGLVTVRAA